LNELQLRKEEERASSPLLTTTNDNSQQTITIKKIQIRNNCSGKKPLNQLHFQEHFSVVEKPSFVFRNMNNSFRA
jgi:hypothetical protein